LKLVSAVPTLGQNVPGKQFTHLWNCLNTEEELYEVLLKHIADYEAMAPQVIEYDARGCDDADIVIVSHGMVSRAALSAYNHFRAQGVKIGYFRPITVRPFPDEQLRAIADKTKKLLIAESAQGQFLKMVQAGIYGSTTEIETLLRPGLGITTEEIIDVVEQIKL
jgi:2-oxoglutarate ferredoxin oxidoreductase subunit alpha